MNHLSAQTLQVCRHVIASQVLSAGDPNFEEASRLAIQALKELDAALDWSRATEATEATEAAEAAEAPVTTVDEVPVAEDPVAEAPVTE